MGSEQSKILPQVRTCSKRDKCLFGFIKKSRFDEAQFTRTETKMPVNSLQNETIMSFIFQKSVRRNVALDSFKTGIAINVNATCNLL